MKQVIVPRTIKVTWKPQLEDIIDNSSITITKHPEMQQDTKEDNIATNTRFQWAHRKKLSLVSKTNQSKIIHQMTVTWLHTTKLIVESIHVV